MSSSLFAFALSSQTIVMLLIVGVLLFGRRLPEVGKSLGKGITEFKKGLGGIEDEFTQMIFQAPQPRPEAPRAPVRTEPISQRYEASAAAIAPSAPPLG